MLKQVIASCVKKTVQPVLSSSPSRNGARAYFRAHLRVMVRVRQSWPTSELTFAQWCAYGNLVITNYYSINSTATVGAQNRSSHCALRTRSNRSMKTRYNRFCLVIENQALFQQPSLLCHLEYRMLQVDQAQERSVRKGQSIGSMSTTRISRWKRSRVQYELARTS